jgi:hypothetical protein
MSKRRLRLLLALGLAAAAAPAMAATAEKYVLQCGNAKSVPPDDECDPVLLTRIQRTIQIILWPILLILQYFRLARPTGLEPVFPP